MALKQAIVIRSDLGMGKGKLAAQSSHASLSAYKKVVLKVGSEEELLSLYEKMKRVVPCALIRDAGHTQLEPGTISCFGAGPADEKIIDKFLGHLKLL